MLTLLWIIYVLDCLLLIGIILLQPGEGADLAAAFGGSSQTAFGARGSATFMQKLTTGLAVMFMVLSILLVMLSNRRGGNLLERSLPAGQIPKNTPASAPVNPAPKPAAAPAQQQVPAAVPVPIQQAPATAAIPVAPPPSAAAKPVVEAPKPTVPAAAPAKKP